MPEHDHDCETSYSGKSNLSSEQTYGLATFNITVLLLNIIFNSLVIRFLLKSQSLKRVGFKLIFCLSVSDICLAVVAQPLFTIMLLKYPQQNDCDMELVVQFFAILLTHTSGYIIAFIGYDRYARVHYLNRYGAKITHQRVNYVMVIIFILSSMQATLYVLGTELLFFDQAKKVAVIIDALTAISVFIFYLLTLRELRNQRKKSTVGTLKDVNQSMLKLASKILLSILIFYVSYVAIAMTHSIKAKNLNGKQSQILDFMLIFAYIMTYCNSFVNALIFLGTNPKAKKFVKSLFARKTERKNEESITISDSQETSTE